jgi:hypothetical protein
MRLTVLILALFSVSHAQKFRFSLVSQSVITQREAHPPASQGDREARIKQLFVQAGCPTAELTEQSLEKLAGANVICRLPGKSSETIIVGASYSQMAPDNWSGAALLPSLFQTLVGRKRRHTFMFVAFADGNADVAGAQYFATHLSPAERDHIEAMINLDPLGFSPTKISSADSDKKLVESFFTVTYILKQMASQVDISKSMRVDSEPFARLQIPHITIHSLTQEAVADLHTAIAPPGGQSNNPQFRPDHYYHSYRLVSGYLAYLDETLKPHRHEK